MTTHTARTFPLMGSQATPLATGADTDDGFELIEIVVGPGGRSPLHTVPSAKVFWVLDGRLAIVVDGVDLPRPAGSVVVVPAGTPHCYRNDGEAPARILVAAAGSGHAAFLEGMSRLTADGPPDRDAVAAHTAAHGVTILPPPS